MTKTIRRSGRDPRPEPKRARVGPNGYLPPGFAPRFWALWRYEWRYDEGRDVWEPFKPTYSPRTLRKFCWRAQDGHWRRSLERGMWGTFGEALGAYRNNAERFDGIGYVLEPELSLLEGGELYHVVTDLDGCRDPETGGIEPWAERVIEEQGTFVEISPSGTGVHLIGYGRKPRRSKMVFEVDGRRIENYGGGVGNRRFMTYTGVTP